MLRALQRTVHARHEVNVADSNGTPGSDGVDVVVTTVSSQREF
jgi:hypothetical protein